MRSLRIIFFVLFLTSIGLAENYLINGGQESKIEYSMQQQVSPATGTKKLVLSYVIPQSFKSPTYQQKISNFRLDFSVAPSKREEDVDKRGNKIVRVIWKKPKKSIQATIRFTAANSTSLNPLQTRAPFPLTKIPRSARMYLASTEQVPSKNSEIAQKARQLTAGAKTEFDAVQKILSWVVDHLHYVLIPKQYDAMYSFRTGKGNCQNYSHLAAALLRAVDIPARIVNGITLKEPYDVKTSNGIITMRMAQGRHSWIEVYFPDLGWVPFDPQQTELFVSNRFIRVEVGLDNNETRNDGLIRWTQSRGYDDQPKFQENISATFQVDRVQLSADKQNYGPQKLLFCPPVDATFTKMAVAPPPPKPAHIPKDKLKKLRYSKPFIFGNLDFPRNVDFVSARGPAQKGAADEMEMRKNFLVETAEYVTTQGTQYAQTFILKKPVKLIKIGLALHKFGGDGQIWVELLKDDGQGRPGEPITSSTFRQIDQLPFIPGYDWVDFDFSRDAPILSPGRYWVALGFTGSPIINWFFTYGKPVGPTDGTRYRTIFDETWSRSLSFEFNYRVLGYTTK